MNTNDLTKHIEVAASSLRSRLFRNNTAVAWVGDARHEGTTVILRNARPLHAGLCTGSSDLIGWTTVEVTPDMVGRRVAVFTAVEVKNGSDRASKAQKAFIAAVKAQGGIAGVARTVEDAEAVIKSFPQRRVDSE